MIADAVLPRRRSRPASRGGIRSGRLAWLYLSPALLIFAVFTIGPAIFVLYISLFDWNLLNSSLSKFVGSRNYRDIAHSSDFWHSIEMSAYFVGAVVAGSTVFGLGIALLLSSRGLVRRIVRLAVLTPYFTPLGLATGGMSSAVLIGMYQVAAVSGALPATSYWSPLTNDAGVTYRRSA